MRAALRARTAALRRSVHLRHVDAGSDGTEEQEIAALLNPVYDIHRLGIFFTASPRHADVLLVTGAGAHGMAEPLRRTYDGMPDPKIVIAVGTDACSGGLLGRGVLRHLGRGRRRVVPVDCVAAGFPAASVQHPAALLLGALGRAARIGSRTGDRLRGGRSPLALGALAVAAFRTWPSRPRWPRWSPGCPT